MRSRRATWSRRTGLLLILAGVVLLGYVGWQLYGTNYVSQRRHDSTVEALREEWSRPGGTVSVNAGDSLSDAIMRVPAFGDAYAVPLVAGVEDEALASGMGVFPGSAAPGEEGNLALAGHRITHGEPLRDMPDLVAGDLVVIETRDRVFTYVLDTGGEELRVPFTAGWVLGNPPVNPNGGTGPAPGETRLLTLTTCAELFHTDDRLVAFGHLVDSRRR
ncbi:MAG: class E sortase [Pimelobacter sp.]|nr:class E sortase [Pimelobacter sp.]